MLVVLVAYLTLISSICYDPIVPPTRRQQVALNSNRGDDPPLLPWDGSLSPPSSVFLGPARTKNFSRLNSGPLEAIGTRETREIWCICFSRSESLPLSSTPPMLDLATASDRALDFILST